MKEPIYTKEQKEILIDLLAATAVTRFKLQQVEDSLLEDAEISSTIFETNLKAHDLLMALRRNLLE